MKHQQRSAIAIMAAGLVGGTGVGVAAAHLAQPAHVAQPEGAGPVATSPVAAATASSLAGRIHDLIVGTEQMNRRLVASRLDLTRQLRELGRLRERAALAAAEQTSSAVSSPVSVFSPPAVAPAPPSPPPAAHTTTGASGAASGDDDGHDNEKEHDDD